MDIVRLTYGDAVLEVEKSKVYDFLGKLGILNDGIHYLSRGQKAVLVIEEMNISHVFNAYKKLQKEFAEAVANANTVSDLVMVIDNHRNNATLKAFETRLSDEINFD